ncbi:MAG TPA: NnrS family protein [Candidatus Krumholzibacteria bacterium]|jgi:hypothetical protein
MKRPYAFLFPLAAILGTFGVGHWILYGRGYLQSYTGQGHALVQIQGFLACFAFGFLFTMIPRRTQTAPPRAAEVVLSGTLLSIGAVGALLEKWLVSELAFLFALGVLLRFLRGRSGGEANDGSGAGSFVLVRAGLFCGIAGAILVALAAVSTLPDWVLPTGRACLQEGLFLGLVLGMGRLLHPALMGVSGADCGGPRSALRSSQIAGGLLLSSFVAQGWIASTGHLLLAYRIAHGLRGCLVLWYLLTAVGAQRRPRSPGSHRHWIWLAFWMLPLGFLASAAFPSHRVSLMHIVFVGGFGLLSFGVGRHVTLAHGPRPELVHHKSWLVLLFGSLFLFAMLTRVSSDLMPELYWIHIEGAAAAWIAALAVWTWSLVGNLRSRDV